MKEEIYKLGNMEIPLKCGICNDKIINLKYAIRDVVGETYFGWLFRHIKILVTFNLQRRSPEIFIPICTNCFEGRINK